MKFTLAVLIVATCMFVGTNGNEPGRRSYLRPHLRPRPRPATCSESQQGWQICLSAHSSNFKTCSPGGEWIIQSCAPGTICTQMPNDPYQASCITDPNAPAPAPAKPATQIRPRYPSNKQYPSKPRPSRPSRPARPAKQMRSRYPSKPRPYQAPKAQQTAGQCSESQQGWQICCPDHPYSQSSNFKTCSPAGTWINQSCAPGTICTQMPNRPYQVSCINDPNAPAPAPAKPATQIRSRYPSKKQYPVKPTYKVKPVHQRKQNNQMKSKYPTDNKYPIVDPEYNVHPQEYRVKPAHPTDKNYPIHPQYPVRPNYKKTQNNQMQSKYPPKPAYPVTAKQTYQTVKPPTHQNKY